MINRTPILIAFADETAAALHRVLQDFGQVPTLERIWQDQHLVAAVVHDMSEEDAAALAVLTEMQLRELWGFVAETSLREEMAGGSDVS